MKSKLLNAFLVLLTCAIGLFAMEFAFRKVVEKYYYIFPTGLFIADDSRCYALNPLFEGKVRAKEYTTTVKINSKGLPDDEYEYKKPEGTHRILAVGDSWVMQHAVNHGQSFLTLLENKLNSEGKKTEIVAGGVSGYNNIQETDFLEKEGIKYTPDEVWMFWFINDLGSNHEFETTQKPVCVKDGRLIGKQVEGPKTFKEKIFAHLHSFRYIAEKFKGAIKQDAQSAGAQDQKMLSMNHYSEHLNDASTGMYDITFREIESMKNIATKNNASFKVIVVPERASIEGEAQFQKEFGNLPQSVSPDWPSRHLISGLKTKGIETFDLTEPLRQYYKDHSGVDMYKDLDKHWTVEGNKAAMEIIYNIVK